MSRRSLCRPRAPGGLVCLVSDSIGYGYPFDPSVAWLSYVFPPAPAPSLVRGRFATVANRALSGARLTDFLTGRTAGSGDYYIDDLPQQNKIRNGGAAKNLLVMCIGGNDIQLGGDSASEVLAGYATYVADALAADWDTILLLSVLPRFFGGNETYVTERNTLNDGLAAMANDSSVFYGAIDTDPMDDASNATLYGDGVHLTGGPSGGNATLAPIAAAHFNRAIGAT